MIFDLANPEFLVLWLVIPFIIAWRLKKQLRSALRYSDLSSISVISKSWRQKLKPLIMICEVLALVLVVFAMARPRERDTQNTITAEGIDIMLAIDISRSMLIEDMGKDNRLEIVKVVAEKFVKARQSDRVGLTLFSGKSFTQCPLTVDYNVLVELIRQTQTGMIEDGTAIGMGLVNSLNRLRESTAKSKVIILLTDGDNNRGEIDPLTAGELAKALGIRVYTIGAGKDGLARMPIDDGFGRIQYMPFNVKINEQPLREIASMTGGLFFRATSDRMLQEIYDRIGELEKSKVEVKTYLRYKDLYIYFVIPALVFMIVADLMRRTIFQTWP